MKCHAGVQLRHYFFQEIHNLFNTCQVNRCILLSSNTMEVFHMKKVLYVLGTVAAVVLVILGVKKFCPKCCKCKAE